MIGDGMGLAQISATMINGGYAPMNIERAQYIGLAKTYSANNRVTDSAASGTALATGVKTNNGAIGVGVDKEPLQTILEAASQQGLATGLIATYAITNATPAAFIGHVESRRDEEGIALNFLDTDIDLFIGGGKKFFTRRADSCDVTEMLREKGYTIVYTFEDVLNFEHGKLGALLAEESMPKMSEGRGDFLPKATAKALTLLKSASDKGFFIMVEGSMIDAGGHRKDPAMVFAETLDFDQAVKEAFDFADCNPGTLVVVTADHETGGLSIPSGKPDFSLPDQGVKYEFSTGGHTGIMVPIYAYGTGAQEFSRIMENTDIPIIMKKLLGLQ